MRFAIRDDGGPIFRQIADQIGHRILSGSLPGGSELPTIRSLATDLVVNPNTVVRAYRELEDRGLIEKRRTAGTYVRGDVRTRSLAHRRQQLQPAVADLLAAAEGLGFTVEELCELIQRQSKKRR